MNERNFGNATLDRPEVSSNEYSRGGYADIQNQVGIRMYQLPPKVAEVLRNSGSSVLDRTATSTSRIEAVIPEPVVEPVVTSEIDPFAEVVKEAERITKEAVDGPVETPVADESVRAEATVSETTEQEESVIVADPVERYRPSIFRTLKKIGRTALSRVGLVTKPKLRPSQEAADVQENRKPKTRAVALLAAFGVSGAVLFNAAPANADEIVIWGGMGDPTGQGYEHQLRATNQIGPNDTVHRVQYPASIGPIGPVSMQESIDVGVTNGRPILNHAYASADPGEKVVIRGYSEGGIPAAVSANERSGGGPVAPGTVIIDSSPVSSTGIFANEDPLVQAGLGMANTMNIPTHHRAPAGSEVRGSENDLWAYGGQGSVAEVIPKAVNTFMNTAHAVQNPHVPGARTWVGPDGITQVQWAGNGTGGVPGIPAPAGSGSYNNGSTAVAVSVPNTVQVTEVARPTSPIIPETRAVSRAWKESHPERYPEYHAQKAEKEAKKSRSTNGSMTSSSYSKKYSPPTKAPQTQLNKKKK